LTRVFREEVGLTPKQHVRVQRFRSVLRRIRTGQHTYWARLAAECGYYDQAHLINEFQALAGVNPGTYLRDRTEQSPAYLILGNETHESAETHVK
jgi:AraC-like DNA-binding protein